MLDELSEADLSRFRAVVAYCEMADVNIGDLVTSEVLDDKFVAPRRLRARELIEMAMLSASRITDRISQEMCYVRIGESVKVARYDPLMMGLLGWLRSEFSSSPLSTRLY